MRNVLEMDVRRAHIEVWDLSNKHYEQDAQGAELAIKEAGYELVKDSIKFFASLGDTSRENPPLSLQRASGDLTIDLWRMAALWSGGIKRRSPRA